MRKRAADEWPGDIPPEAILVRGTFANGEPETVEYLTKAARRPLNEYGYFGLSVATFPLDTPQAITRRYGLPNEYFGTTTREGLAEVQPDDVRLTGYKEGHATVIFNNAPSEAQLRAFIKACGTPVRNRAARSKKRRRRS